PMRVLASESDSIFLLVTFRRTSFLCIFPGFDQVSAEGFDSGHGLEGFLRLPVTEVIQGRAVWGNISGAKGGETEPGMI
ncbi:MAG: hypothetical protein IJR36_03295, partial [Lachnospiraceae bacterium]|nr:hypothetical protein [Lachnospiraceae bacterium]